MSEIPIKIEGLKFLANFPKWADERAKVQMWLDEEKHEVVIIVIHPDHAPHKYNHGTGTWDPIKV